MRSSPTKYFLAELHDVHPTMPISADDILAKFPSVPEEAWAWLVVPDWYGREPLEKHGQFTDRLLRSPATKVLHGWSHLRGPSLWHRALYDMEDRSEFAALDQKETLSRIERGGRLFETMLGDRPQWFCPPRWTLGKAARRGLAEANLPGGMALRELTWQDRSIPAPVINFDVGRRLILRRLNQQAVRRGLSRLMADYSLLRFVVHPIDLTFPETRDVMMKVFERLADEGWAPTGLGEIAESLAGRATAAAQGH